MNRQVKKMLKEEWRKYQEDNPNLKRTFAHHHYFRTRYASKFWLKKFDELFKIN